MDMVLDMPEQWMLLPLMVLAGWSLADCAVGYTKVKIERTLIAQKVIAKLKGTSNQEEHFFMVLTPTSSNINSKIDKIIYCEKFVETPYGYADVYIPAPAGQQDWANVTITTGFNGKSWTVVSIDNTNPWITKLRLAEVGKPKNAAPAQTQYPPQFRNSR